MVTGPFEIPFTEIASCVKDQGPGILARDAAESDIRQRRGALIRRNSRGRVQNRIPAGPLALLAQKLQAASVIAPERTFLTGYWDATAEIETVDRRE